MACSSVAQCPLVPIYRDSAALVQKCLTDSPALVPKCLGSEVSWVWSVLTPSHHRPYGVAEASQCGFQINRHGGFTHRPMCRCVAMCPDGYGHGVRFFLYAASADTLHVYLYPRRQKPCIKSWPCRCGMH